MDGLLVPGSDDWWRSLPTKVKASVRKGIEEADQGEFEPEDEVQRVRAQWRSR